MDRSRAALALPAAPGPGAAVAPPRPGARRPRLLTFGGVYAPQDDSWLLAAHLARLPLAGADVLDLCSGTGVQAVTAAAAGARSVTAVELGRRASLVARANLRRHRAPGRVLRGDLFEPVLGRRFDVVVANPPYVPAAGDALPRAGAARAWDAGCDGRVVLDRICAQAADVLRPGGRLLLVHSHVCGVGDTIALLARRGFDARIAERRRIAFGPVMRAREELLRAGGRLAESERDEELVVVDATLEGP